MQFKLLFLVCLFFALVADCFRRRGMGISNDMEGDGYTKGPENQMIRHARDGEISSLVDIIESHKDIDIEGKDYWDCTALRLAAAGGHTDCVKYLIEKGAEIDVIDKKGQTPLFAAVFSRQSEAVRVLLEHGADPMGSTQNISFPLKIAVMNGDIDIIQSLLKYGADINCVRDKVTKLSGPPLSSVLNPGKLDLLRLLLLAGANPNFGIENKHIVFNAESPFETAIRRNLDLVPFELLYEFGCRTSSTNKQETELWQLTETDEIRNYLQRIRSIPRDLKSSCRLKMWLHYGRKLLKYLDLYSVPTSIRQYLVFDEF